MMKIELNKLPLIHPTTIVVVGTMNHGKPNYTTIGDIAVAGVTPPLIMISINKDHKCMEHINEHHTMSINILPMEYMKEVDHAGMFSAKSVDKSELFYSDIIMGVPLIREAKISLIIQEHSRVEIEHRTILVCDVMKTFVDQDMIENNLISLSSIRPILYGLDNNYYTTGEIIGKGYHEGRYLHKK